MRKTILAGLSVLFALGVARLAVELGAPAGAEASAVVGAEAAAERARAAPEPVPLDAPSAGAARTSRDEPRAAESRAARPAELGFMGREAAAPKPEAPPAVLAGRLVDASGAGLLGSVELEGAAPDPRDVRDSCSFEALQPLVVKADAAGHFEIEVSAGDMLRLRPRAAGCAARPLGVDPLEPGERRELGEIELAASGQLTVALEDLAGEPATSADFALVCEGFLPAQAAGLAPAGAAILGAARLRGGSANVRDLPPGRCVVVLLGRDRLPRAAAWAEIAPGEHAVLALVDSGADPERALWVEVRPRAGSAAFDARALAEGVRLAQLGGAARAPDRVAPPFAVFDDLESAHCALEVELAGFEPWAASAAPGRAARLAALTGTAGLAVAVEDARTGVPVDGARCIWNLGGELQPARRAGGVLEFTGLAPGGWQLEVRAPGYAPAVLSTGLQAGETRSLAVPLDPL